MVNNNNFAAEIKEKKFVKDKMTAVLNDPSFKGAKDDIRSKVKKNMITIVIVIAVIGVAAAVAFGILAKSWIAPLFPIGFALVAALIACFVCIHNGKNKYAKLIAPSIIEGLYGPNANYNPNGGYTREYLEGLDSFPVRSLNQGQAISGHYAGVQFNIANVESYHYETRGSGKDAHQERVTDFLGSVLNFKMNKPSKATLKVVEGSSLFSGKSIDFESVEFNKKFNVYCSDRENAFYIITPQVQLALLEIEKGLPGGLKILFRGEEMVIIASGNTTTFKGIDTKKDENYNINVILDSILAPAFVVETMNLDHKFFIEENDTSTTTQAEKEKKEDEEDKAEVMKGLSGGALNDEDIKDIKDTIEADK